MKGWRTAIRRRPATHGAHDDSSFESSSITSGKLIRNRAHGQCRRLVHAAYQQLQFGCQLATLLHWQKLAYLADPAVRLDDELVAVEGRIWAADFNPGPVAREHDALWRGAPRAMRELDGDFRLGDVDVFAVVPSLHIRTQCPAEEQHLGTGERQHRPETEEGRDAGDAEGGETDRAEKQHGSTHAERAMRGQVYVGRGGLH